MVKKKTKSLVYLIYIVLILLSILILISLAQIGFRLSELENKEIKYAEFACFQKDGGFTFIRGYCVSTSWQNCVSNCIAFDKNIASCFDYKETECLIKNQINPECCKIGGLYD